MPAPQFGVADRPRDIIDGSGRWLAEQLGWRWVKRRGQVEFRHGPQLLQLGLQSSRYSRAGLATWVYTRVAVSDDDLPRWRAAHPEATLFPSPADQPRRFVYNSLLINVERDLDEIECSGLRPRLLGLGEFAAAFGQRVLPVLRLFRSPGLAAPELPVSWLGMIGCETVEWALARDDPGAAALLIRRHIQRPLRGQQTWRGRSSPSGAAGKSRRTGSGWRSRCCLSRWKRSSGWRAFTAWPTHGNSASQRDLPGMSCG